MVTGGAGFIGSHLVDALVGRGDLVHVLDNLATGKRENLSDAELHVGDIRSDCDALFDDVRPEACFHFAAQADVRVSVDRPDFDADVNVLGTVRVLEAARRHGTKVVFASTGGAIYGECDGPANEDAPRRPLAPYGTSKLAGEEYLQTYNRLHASTHTVLRLGNVYGPRQDPHGEAGVVAIFMKRLREGERPRIFGDGMQTRDYVFVVDAVQAAVAALGSEGGVYNVATGTETSVVELLERIQSVTGTNAEAEFAPPRPGELQRSVLDVSRADAELGWRPRHDLDAGLAATWAWMAER